MSYVNSLIGTTRGVC